MKKYLLILFIYFASGLTTLQAHDFYAYPSYDSVVTKFFNEYSIQDKLEDNTKLQFEKNPEGWSVCIFNYQTSSCNEKHLFWNLKTKSYEHLPYEKYKPEVKDGSLFREFMNSWEKMYYAICPYYGYDGWDWDVITHYEHETSLSDTLLYGIGRAYSSYASNLLNDNSGYAKNDQTFKLPEGPSCLSADQLATYRKYRHLAIDYFKRLSVSNPLFQTIVGNIPLKTANEYAVSYLDLLIYQNREEAQKELIDQQYEPFYIELAKNYLNSCEPHAILFTNGDSDTYPLLYVQEKLQYRRDVTVINYSLFQTHRYINLFRKPVISDASIHFSFTEDEILNDNRNVIIIEDNKTTPSKTMSLSSLISYLKDTTHQKKYGDVNYYYIENRSFTTKLNGKNMPIQVDGNYILKNQLMVYDLLASEKKYPVYFATTMGEDSYCGLQNYFQQTGLAYKITPSANQADPTAMNHALMNVFDYSHLLSATGDDFRFVANYAVQFENLAELYIQKKNLSMAKKVLDTCLRIIPDNFYHYDRTFIPLVEQYYKIQSISAGNQLAEHIINNYNTHTLNYTEQHSDTDLNYTMAKLKEILLTYGQQQLVRKIKN